MGKTARSFHPQRFLIELAVSVLKQRSSMVFEINANHHLRMVASVGILVVSTESQRGTFSWNWLITPKLLQTHPENISK
jgi:hypothetical protein